MASVAVRRAVYDLLVADAALIALGFTSNTIYPNWGPDSPMAQRFMVLRWGATTRGVGRANSAEFTPWVYDRDQDFAAIAGALDRMRPAELGGDGLLDTLVGARLGVGPDGILGIDWQGASTDLYDDGYRANVRNETYNITASGN